MQQHDQTDPVTTSKTASVDTMQDELHANEESADKAVISVLKRSGDNRGGFDWLALSISVLIAAIFSVAGRLYAQPTTSLVPVAVLSASGCGLLITALRKLRTSKGSGVLEAALAGLCVALLQFLAALSYPGVEPSLGNEQLAGPGFFSTWGLIAIFAVLFSMIGATLGHLAFAPLRPLPAKNGRQQSRTQAQHVHTNLVDEDTQASQEQQTQEAPLEVDAAPSLAQDTPVEVHEETDHESEQIDEGEASPSAQSAASQRTLVSYAITVLMLGFIPMLAGYVFAAAFDFTLSRNGYAPGPFPTLRLLSSLLPWQVPDPVALQGTGSVSVTLSLLWRIPLFFGNPTPFDAQALEPYIFNAAGLGTFLVISLKRENTSIPFKLLWGKLALFEALLGLAIVLPAAFWMLQGLQGVFEFHTVVIALGTLRLLDTPNVVLDLLTSLLVCIVTGILVGTRTRRN
ncbi:MAG TPA: hypothetical protein VGT44_02785 [Ktedonobacteraceae bacterium]|nr:hypothetical protein [Ktedonobacteraceae bacterium]